MQQGHLEVVILLAAISLICSVWLSAAKLTGKKEQASTPSSKTAV
ncbi:hypothetical protein [Ktedonosporobacter rubrisoli]|nr:hypothetical protein [Ktedonosporobacter rubrisoli]